MVTNIKKIKPAEATMVINKEETIDVNGYDDDLDPDEKEDNDDEEFEVE